jgi:hypothetical protein
VIAGHSAALFDQGHRMRRGERALCMCLGVDREQAKIVLGYTRSYFDEIEPLRDMVTRQTANGFELDNGVDVVIATNSFRSIRGRTLLLAILDECAYWRDENSATPDEETYRALVPGLVTLKNSMLIGISSPYRKSGLLYEKFKEFYGKPDDDVLVIRAPSIVLNPTLDAADIDKKLKADPAAAKAEWLAEFRDDIAGFAALDLIEAAVDAGVVTRPPLERTRYVSFCDMSGGAHDSSTCAIAHREGDVAVLDSIIEIKAPHSPMTATKTIAGVLKSYGLRQTISDKYAAGFAVDAFHQSGIKLVHSERDRSELYQETLPLFSSGRVRLFDDKRLVTQFASLERKTNSLGRDSITHPAHGADDLCNAAAGALVLAAEKVSGLPKFSSEVLMKVKSGYRPRFGLRSQFQQPRVFFGTGHEV